MTKETASFLDENTRRYYLEVMGIQSWELLDSKSKNSETPDFEKTGSEKQDTVESLTETGAEQTELQSNRDVDLSQGDLKIKQQGINGQQIEWSQLETSIQQCNKCQLHKTRKQATVGRGNRSAELMFILLSPDNSEDETGVLCNAEAKDLFAKMLAAIKLSINDVYITSLLKCSVPDHHTISANEIHQCSEHLKQQIQLIQPKLLILLGETSTRCFLQKNLALDDFRTWINADYGNRASTENHFESIPLFVSYSPHELLQQPENKGKAWLDLQQLQKITEA
jgi:DNA polymerase